MNRWCEKSIEIAQNGDYLDRLFEIYPISQNPERPMLDDKKSKIEYAYLNEDKVTLLTECFNAEVSPIKNSYIGFFKQDPSAFDRNPKMLNRIYKEIFDLGLDTIIQRMERPAESNRQMGQCFKKYVQSGKLDIELTDCVDDFFASDKDLILLQSDKTLGEIARINFGYGRNTGLDFMCRKNGTYVIGEAKFISASGGNQTNQFNSAINIFSSITTTTKYKVCPIAILDGVIYLAGNNRFFATLQRSNDNIMSALLLKDFLEEL